MLPKQKADTHIHSINSPDGPCSLSLLCECAVKQGVRIVTITDHFEMAQTAPDPFYERGLRQSCLDTYKAREAYRDDLRVLFGVEIGQPHHNRAEADRIVSNFKFDLVLAAVHNLRGEPDFTTIDFRTVPPEGYLRRYFEELIEVVEWGNFDSLAHLTYPCRLIRQEVRLEDYDDLIEQVLKGLVKQGKALEINTQGYRRWLKEAIPPIKYVKWFRELGGEYITIGTDAHKQSHIGANISDAMKLASEAGYHYYCYYEKRKPVMISLK